MRHWNAGDTREKRVSLKVCLDDPITSKSADDYTMVETRFNDDSILRDERPERIKSYVVDYSASDAIIKSSFLW